MRRVEQPGRDLPLARADGVPVLLDQQHPVVVVEGEHRHRAGVRDVLARRSRALVAVAEGVAPDVPDEALEDRLAFGDGQVDVLVDRLALRQALLTSNSRLACWRSRAAATSPRNSGCASFGRLRSSGCACVAT